MNKLEINNILLDVNGDGPNEARRHERFFIHEFIFRDRFLHLLLKVMLILILIKY